VIALFTDFGAVGPYVGQMEAILHQYAPQEKVINLISNAPTSNPILSSYLLAALRHGFPKDTVFLSVVDPGVGGQRIPVVVEADNQYFVGPDNGLFNTISVQASKVCWYEIIWQPEHCSSSFHGRDLFAPVAALLAKGDKNNLLRSYQNASLEKWAADFSGIIYFDYYGNALTGIRYIKEISAKQLHLGDLVLDQAETFCEVKQHQAFWYENSSGLVEIAINQGNAKNQLQLELGMPVEFV
jgi:S-adenosylmethionine hydrolase